MSNQRQTTCLGIIMSRFCFLVKFICNFFFFLLTPYEMLSLLTKINNTKLRI